MGNGRGFPRESGYSYVQTGPLDQYGSTATQKIWQGGRLPHNWGKNKRQTFRSSHTNSQPSVYSGPMQQQQAAAPQQAVYDPRTSNPWDFGQQQQAAATQPAAVPAVTPAPAQQPAAATNQQPAAQQATATTTQPQAQVQTDPSQNPSYTGHPFFDPNSNYQWGGNAPLQFEPDSPIYQNWAEENPQGAYFEVLNELGLGGLDARSQAAQAMYRDYATGYQASKMRNANLWWSQYLAMQKPQIMNQIAQMSNEQLGINEANFTGRDRWALRGY